MATATTQQWTSEAGPRQTKEVEKALSAVRWHAKSQRTLTDYDPSGSMVRVHMAIGRDDGGNPLVAEASTKLGDRYGWKITRENYKSIVADCNEIVATIPLAVVDERTTPEERAERERARVEQEARNKAEAQQHLIEKSKHLIDLKAKYPWAKQDGNSYARAAANLKRELQLAYPHVSWSVRSESYSMGNSVDVSWTDGPTTDQVKAISDKYQAGSFSGMEDIYEDDRSAYSAAVREWLGQSKYVNENRKDSEGTVEKIRGLIRESGYQEPDAWGHWSIDRMAFRLWASTEFPRGTSIVGLAPAPEGVNEHFVLVLSEPPAVGAPVAMVGADGIACRVERHKHTKRNCDVFLVVLDSRVERDQFDSIRDRCKAAGGWYSRQWGKVPGGFAFETEADAEAFAVALRGGN